MAKNTTIQNQEPSYENNTFVPPDKQTIKFKCFDTEVTIRQVEETFNIDGKKQVGKRGVFLRFPKAKGNQQIAARALSGIIRAIRSNPEYLRILNEMREEEMTVEAPFEE